MEDLALVGPKTTLITEQASHAGMHAASNTSNRLKASTGPTAALAVICASYCRFTPDNLPFTHSGEALAPPASPLLRAKDVLDLLRGKMSSRRTTPGLTGARAASQSVVRA